MGISAKDYIKGNREWKALFEVFGDVCFTEEEEGILAAFNRDVRVVTHLGSGNFKKPEAVIGYNHGTATRNLFTEVCNFMKADLTILYAPEGVDAVYSDDEWILRKAGYKEYSLDRS